MACSASYAATPHSPHAAHDAFVRREATRLLRESAALKDLATSSPRELCRVRWLFYRGDENYGLGNVLYDISSAAALALALNRTLVYGADAADRKFGTLLLWPGVLTMHDADGLRRKARCGSGALATRRHVQLAPDRCTFHRTWRKERSGQVRCFKRLLGVNWLAERAPLLELSKVHAFTGLQTLLKSAHAPLRRRVAAFTGGCIGSADSRPNVHGMLLAALMRPSPAVVDAVGWALRQSSGEAGGRAVGAPAIALHVRAMSDHRAKNTSASDQASQMLNGLNCVRRALQLTATIGSSSGGALPRALSVVVVSSSPELRTHLVRRIAARNRRSLAAAGASSASAARGSATLPRVLPFVFDWRAYLAQAARSTVASLSASESAAAAFCESVNASESFRCNRSAHLRDWGPEPHWVAVVELLLVAATTHAVVGAGSPYFKVCNTFTQVGAALADAAPDWLCAARMGGGAGGGADGGAAAGTCGRGPRGVRLLCASRVFSTDWGSSAWRTLNSTARRGSDYVVDCGSPRCLLTPLQPELWAGLHGGQCPADGDTLPPPYTVFGQPIKALLHGHH